MFLNDYFMTKLFLDDIRQVKDIYPLATEYEFVLLRSYEAFIDYIRSNGLPEFISFDNDLGLLENGDLAPDGYAATKWLVYESGLDLRELKFEVHSANPVAAVQIWGLLENYQKFLKEQN